MADEPGDSIPSPSSFEGPNDDVIPTWSGEAGKIEFDRIFIAMQSSDPATREEAAYDFEQIPRCSVASLLWQTFQAAETTEHRVFALDQLRSHLETYWNEIFPNQSTDHELSQFCSLILNEVEYERDTALIQSLSQLIAVVFRWSCEYNGQYWIELLDYVTESPLSASSHHMAVSLEILNVVPNLFVLDSEACHAYFEACLEEKDRSLHRPIVEAFVTVYSSKHCTAETRAALGELHSEIGSMLREAAVTAPPAEGRQIGRTVSNAFANAFIEMCLGTHDAGTIEMCMKVVKSVVFELGNDCITSVTALLDICLHCSAASIRSIALKAYAYIIPYDGRAQTELARLFPLVLQMAQAPLPSEEPDNGAARVRGYREECTPLEVLEHMASARDQCPLLLPHLREIITMSHKAVEGSLPSESGRRPRAGIRDGCWGIRTLHSLLDNYWDEILERFGLAFVNELCEWTLDQTPEDADNQPMHEYLAGIFARNEATAPFVSEYIVQRGCLSSDDPRLKRIALEAIRAAPGLFEVSVVTSHIEKALTLPALRSAALHAFYRLAESLKEDGAKVEKLHGTVALIIKCCEGEPSAPMAGRNGLSPLDCVSDMSWHHLDLLQPHFSALISMLCRLTLDPYAEHADGMRILTGICEEHAEMVNAHASDHIADILECCMLEAAHKFPDSAYGSWVDWTSVERGRKGAAKVDKMVEKLGGLDGPYDQSPLRKIYSKLKSKRRLGTDTWHTRFLHIMVVRAIAARCDLPRLSSIVHFLLRSLADQEPQVINKAISVLGQLALLRAPILQDRFHGEIIPALIGLLKTSPVRRISFNAAETLAAFIANCSKSSVLDVSHALFETVDHLHSIYLDQLTVRDGEEGLEHLLSPICALAETDPLLIYANYERVMAPLRSMLHERPSGEMLLVVVHVVAVCGEAAGRSRFKADGYRVITAISFNLAKLLRGSRAFSDDLSRVVRVIGEDAAGCLPSLVPPLIAALKEYKDYYIGADQQRKWDLKHARDNAAAVLKALSATLADQFEPYAVDVAKLQ